MAPLEPLARTVPQVLPVLTARRGPQGPQGAQGLTGTAGLRCWDLNANGVGESGGRY